MVRLRLREILIQKALELNPEECLQELQNELIANIQQDGESWEKCLGKCAKGIEITAFDAYWDTPNNVMSEVILAMKLATEHAAFCQEKLDHETVGQIADALMRSKVWYFWWD